MSIRHGSTRNPPLQWGEEFVRQRPTTGVRVVLLFAYFVQDLHDLVAGILLGGADERYDLGDGRLER